MHGTLITHQLRHAMQLFPRAARVFFSSAVAGVKRMHA